MQKNAPSEDALSAQSTPERSRMSTSKTDLTNITNTSAVEGDVQTQFPRRYMRNGVLLFDHRFDPAGTALKDGLPSFLSVSLFT